MSDCLWIRRGLVHLKRSKRWLLLCESQFYRQVDLVLIPGSLLDWLVPHYFLLALWFLQRNRSSFYLVERQFFRLLSFLSLFLTFNQNFFEIEDILFCLRIWNDDLQSIDDIQAGFDCLTLVSLIFFDSIDAAFEEESLHKVSVNLTLAARTIPNRLLTGVKCLVILFAVILFIGLKQKE